jgi:hypothetical protein
MSGTGQAGATTSGRSKRADTCVAPACFGSPWKAKAKARHHGHGRHTAFVHRISPLLCPSETCVDIDGLWRRQWSTQMNHERWSCECQALSTCSSIWHEHITTCTAIMKSAFARLRSVPTLLALDSRRAGRRMLQILFAATPCHCASATRTRPWTQVQQIPERVHRSIPCLIRCPFLVIVLRTRQLWRKPGDPNSSPANC